MLFEKTSYLDDFPINIRIAKVKEYLFHYHQDVELIYVLKGEIHLKNMCHDYLLKEGDIFTNSGHEVHGMTATDKENIVAIIQVSNRFFTQYFPSLHKACFMTYVKDDKYLMLDTLRKTLLHILLDYSRRSFNYKEACIDQMIEVIKYLNQHFNLFAFRAQTVIGFDNDNPVAAERISRIINYVYANHANKITLKELAEREHLSMFYLSHLIRNYMGINFKEFLCFARAEMSEILLLETNRKISTIARDVGFSTTLYYEKFFSKWYGHSPSEHRRLHKDHVLSNTRRPMLELLSANQAVRLISRCLSAVSDQEKSSTVINRHHYTIGVDPLAKPIMPFQPSLEVMITTEDYRVMGERLFNILDDLNAAGIILACTQGEDEAVTQEVASRLNSIGLNVSMVCHSGISYVPSAGYDSIASAIGIFQTYFSSKERMLLCKLRDQGDPSKVLKGFPCCITSGFLPKPPYYAYRLLARIKGNLIYREKNCYVIKNNLSIRDSYTLVVLNTNDDIQNLLLHNTGVHEANDIINSYMDEININFDFSVIPGQYMIAKYALANSNSIFAHMSHLGFPEVSPLSREWINMLNTEPRTQVSVEEVDDRLHINSWIKGAGVQVIVVERVER